jgi:DNA-directed RNA polymerase specialized sigma24 family protein
MMLRSPDFFERSVAIEQHLFGAEGQASKEARALEQRVRRLLDRLPPIEADFVTLFYFDRLSQDTIAAIFEVSQPTVCYRLQRALERLRFLLALPRGASADAAVELLRPALPEPLDLEVVRLMWSTTCQSLTGARLGITQGKVRYRFHRAIRQVARALDDGVPWKSVAQRRRVSAYLHVLQAIAKQPNILSKE